MRSINENEMSRLMLWAAQEEKSVYFEGGDSGPKDSFWQDRQKRDTEIREYGFKTVPEFEALCADIMGHEFDTQIKKVVSVAMIKNMPREKKKEKPFIDGETLPEYIYVF